jgi:hypothetical protein
MAKDGGDKGGDDTYDKTADLANEFEAFIV